MRFLHLADLHLDSPMLGLSLYEGVSAPTASVTREAFTRAVDYARDTAVDLVVIAGDIYDGEWRDFSTGLFFARQMLRLQQAGIPVVLIHGNHDSASTITRVLPLPDNVTVLAADRAGTKRFDSLQVAVHGQSFAQREVHENLVAAYPERVSGFVNIGLLHTSLGGLTGHDTYAPTTAAQLERLNYDYWALGHIHRRQQPDPSLAAYYSGVVQGRSVRETGAHGGIVVSLDPGMPPTVEYVDFDVLRFEELELDARQLERWDDLPAVANALLVAAVEEAEGRQLACRVRLFGASTMHAELLADPETLRAQLELAAAACGGELWIERVIVATEPADAHATVLDAELDDAVEAALADGQVVDELLDATRAMRGRLPQELLADEAPLAWLKDETQARERLLELGKARLLHELGVRGLESGNRAD